MRQTPVIVSLILLSAFVALAEPPASSDPPALLPIPKYAEQNKADVVIREKFKTELASREPGDRLALAHKFCDMAAAGVDSASQYVLLRRARDCAVNAGDFPFAMSIIDETAKTFAINVDEMKVSALTIGMDTAAGAPGDLAISYLKVADNALNEWNPALASKAAYLAHKLARGNPALLADTNQHDKLAKLQNHELLDIVNAQKKLERNPDDAQSNFLLGRHGCFHLNRWELGLPYLAKSPPGKIKDLAVRDLAAPTDPTEMAALADGWWDYTDPKGEVSSILTRRRAAYWYGKALPGLNGEKKAEAEKRIAEAK